MLGLRGLLARALKAFLGPVLGKLQALYLPGLVAEREQHMKVLPNREHIEGAAKKRARQLVGLLGHAVAALVGICHGEFLSSLLIP